MDRPQNSSMTLEQTLEDGEYLVIGFLLAAQERETRRWSRFIMISSEELAGLTFSGIVWAI